MNSTATAPTLAVYQCLSCRTLSQRAPIVCAQCLQRHFQPVEVTASGVLASWTTVRKPPLRFKSEGMYHIGVFDLENGMRVSGRLVSSSTASLGDRVELVTDDLTQIDIPTFKVVHDD